jgi:hypothetical protein
MHPRFWLSASPSGDHYQAVLVASSSLARLQNLRDFDKNEDGADGVDMALVSLTDRQLMVLLVWTSCGMREILSVLGKIVQLTFDTSSGLRRPPDRHPGGITYRLTHL